MTNLGHGVRSYHKDLIHLTAGYGTLYLTPEPAVTVYMARINFRRIISQDFHFRKWPKYQYVPSFHKISRNFNWYWPKICKTKFWKSKRWQVSSIEDWSGMKVVCPRFTASSAPHATSCRSLKKEKIHEISSKICEMNNFQVFREKKRNWKISTFQGKKLQSVKNFVKWKLKSTKVCFVANQKMYVFQWLIT